MTTYTPHEDVLYQDIVTHPLPSHEGMMEPLVLVEPVPPIVVKVVLKLLGISAGASTFLAIFYYLLLHIVGIFHDLSLLLGGLRW